MLRTTSFALISLAAVVACKSSDPGYRVETPKPSSIAPCRELDGEGIQFRDAIVRTLASDTAAHTSMRSGVGLTKLPADSVILVTDGSICRRAQESFRKFRGPQTALQGVYTFRVANRFIVHGPDGHSGIVAFVMDPSFRILQGWGF